MSTIRKVLISLFILLVVGTAGIIFMVKSWNVFADGSNNKVFQNSSFSVIDIQTDNATVIILPSNDSTTTVEYSGEKRKNSKYILHADVKDEKLTVQLKNKRKFFISFDFTFERMVLTVKVPEKQYDRILVDSDNGRINVENMNAKDISFATDNGTVELKNIEADAIDVKSDNGKIILNQVTGKINGRTDNGSISLVTNNLDRVINLTTDNGRIDIETDQEPENATIDVKTDNGKISVFGNANEKTVYGKGENLIKLRSDNGRITVTN